MAKMIIKHNGFTINLAQKEHGFIYEIIGADNNKIVLGNVYVGDGDKLSNIGQRIKSVTGLDIEIDSN